MAWERRRGEGEEPLDLSTAGNLQARTQTKELEQRSGQARDEMQRFAPPSPMQASHKTDLLSPPSLTRGSATTCSRAACIRGIYRRRRDEGITTSGQKVAEMRTAKTVPTIDGEDPDIIMHDL